MFCRKCGTDTGSNTEFCRKCGGSPRTLPTSTTKGAAAAVAPALYLTAQPSKQQRELAVWVLLPVLLFVVSLVATSARQLERKPMSRTEQIANTPVTVNANGYYQYKFEVPPGARNVFVQGYFSAVGGIGNDIELYIVGKDDFEDWRAGRPIRSHYQSGQLNRGTINASLDAKDDSYYLVLNNQFSHSSSKVIQLDIRLTYDL